VSHDDWDDYCDLDGYGGEATGDRSIDELGYQSPRHLSQTQRHQQQLKRDREQQRVITQAIRDATLARNRQETKARNAARRGKPAPEPEPPAPQAEPKLSGRPDSFVPPVAFLTGDELPAEAALATMRQAPGREAGWWRVDMTANGATWTKVDQADDDGRPRVVAHGPEPASHHEAQLSTAMDNASSVERPRRRWWQWRRPQPTDPPTSPGTTLY
jgi:hypothetical protein